MSLPTIAYFLYKGEVVHHPFCNAGWWYDGDVIKLIKKMVQYDDDIEKFLSKKELEEAKENKKFPFLPLCDWDEIEVYGIRTKRSELKGI